MNRRIEDKLSDLYLEHFGVLSQGLPPSVNSSRRNWLESFMLRGIPSARDERYRHFDLRKMLEGKWEYRIETQQEACGRGCPCAQLDGYRINVSNGFCSGPLIELDNGIAYGSLREAMKHSSVQTHFNSVADNEGEAVTALNSLFFYDGAVVFVPKGVKADKPFILSFGYNDSDNPHLIFSRALIVIEEGAQADVMICHSGKGDIFANFVREIVVMGGGSLNINSVNTFSDEAVFVSGNYLSQWEHSFTSDMEVWLRGGRIRVNAITNLAGSDCDSSLRGLYFGTGTQLIDVNMTVRHLVPDCRSSELVKGVVSDEATGSFTGRVYVAQDAQKTSAMQQSRNIQLSEGARIFTEPQLEIYADDVKCTHGATVGQIDDEMIFYMRQRGISEEDSRRLRLFGFVNDIISGCTVSDACPCINRMAEERINEL